MNIKSLPTTRRDILNIKFDLVDYAFVMNKIERWRNNRESHYVTITNPHSVLLCHRDSDMRRATEMAGMTLPDGVGIILAAQLLGYPHEGRVTGPMLMLKLCDLGRQNRYRHFFYGGAPGIADKLAKRLLGMYPGLTVAGTYCPPFRPISGEEDQRVMEMLNASKPDIVWVGLGAPKQEKWMESHLGRIHSTVMIGVGAAFDFHAKNVKWAPKWIRDFGFEWLYRTIGEPSRVGHKAMDNVVFALKVLKLCFVRRSRTTG